MTTRLINIEGIDCCGKTSISQIIADKLHYIYRHEPNFSSIKADRLNSMPLDPWQREYYFMKDRMNDQPVFDTYNVVLDRYILTGLAYAQTFSPQVVPMMKSIYFMPDEFKRPDVIVFLDIEPSDAMKLNELKKGTPDYSTRMSVNSLQIIRDNFKLHFQTMREWEIPLIIVNSVVGALQETAIKIIDNINVYL